MILSIGTAKENQTATEQLAHCLKGGGLEIELATLGGWVFLGCKLAGGELVESGLLRSFVADAVTELLLNQTQKELVEKVLRHEHRSIPPKEREQIANRSMEILNLDPETGEEDRLRLRQRRNYVYGRLMECLAGRPQIVLEGFVRFRLKDYYQELRLAVDLAVEEYNQDLEYQDFISLLRSFVEIQPPQFELLHVLASRDKYLLLDQEEIELEAELLEEPLPGMEPEDLLLSNLITLAPENLVLHLDPDNEISQTIIGVFQEQVLVCYGCNLCK